MIPKEELTDQVLCYKYNCKLMSLIMYDFNILKWTLLLAYKYYKYIFRQEKEN